MFCDAVFLVLLSELVSEHTRGHAQIRNHFKNLTEKYCKAKTLHLKTSFKEDQLKASFMWYSMKLPLNYSYS